MLKVVELGQSLESEKVLRTLLDLRRKPFRIRIVCPIIKHVKMKDFDFRKGLIRLLASGTTITIITGDFLESKSKLNKRAEFLKQEFNRGKISDTVYNNLLNHITHQIKRIEETENLLLALKGRKASVFCHRRLHAKVIIVESRKETLALVMSSNITPSGLEKNIEIGVLLSDEECINKINRYLDRIIGYGGTRIYDMV